MSCGIFNMMMANAARRVLPYTPVAYLKSTGTQYINTGVLPDFANGDEIEIRFYAATYTGAQPCACGSRETGVLNGFYALATGLTVADGSGYSAAANWQAGYDHTLIINDSNVIVDGTSHTMPRRVTCGLPAYLFALNNYDGTAIVFYNGMKLYEWTYRRNGVVAQHLVPALDLNGVPCMWDTVSNTPLYNAGSGDFVADGVPYDGVQGVFLKEGATVVSSAMKMTGATVTTGQIQYVYARGVAWSATCIAGGYQRVSSGGVARDTVLSSGGGFDVYVGGSVVGVACLSGGTGQAQTGGTVANATIAGGRLNAGPGGIVANPVVSRGLVYMYTSGLVSGGTVFSGGLVQGGGSAHGVTVSSGGSINLLPNAVVSSLTIASAGHLLVQSRASALAVTSNAGALVNVLDGGYIEYVTSDPVWMETGAWAVNRYNSSVVYSSALSIDSYNKTSVAEVHVFNNGSIGSLVLDTNGAKNGNVKVYSGGLISSIDAKEISLVIEAGGYVDSAYLHNSTGSMTISGAGSVGSLLISSAKVSNYQGLHVGTLTQSSFGGTYWFDGTVCSSALIYANHMNISSGATALAITLFSGGHVSVFSGGTALGVANSGGDIYVQDGGYIEYINS